MCKRVAKFTYKTKKENFLHLDLKMVRSGMKNWVLTELLQFFVLFLEQVVRLLRMFARLFLLFARGDRVLRFETLHLLHEFIGEISDAFGIVHFLQFDLVIVLFT